MRGVGGELGQSTARRRWPQPSTHARNYAGQRPAAAVRWTSARWTDAAGNSTTPDAATAGDKSRRAPAGNDAASAARSATAQPGSAAATAAASGATGAARTQSRPATARATSRSVPRRFWTAASSNDPASSVGGAGHGAAAHRAAPRSNGAAADATATDACVADHAEPGAAARTARCAACSPAGRFRRRRTLSTAAVDAT